MILWPKAVGIDIAIRKMRSNPAKFIGSKYAPMTESQFQEVEYDEIYGPVGMTNSHALNSEPKLVKFPKVVRKLFKAAYFKETHRIDESDILKLRNLGGSEQQRISAQQLVAVGLDSLNIRIENRVEWMRWQALINGRVQIDENKVKVNAVYGIPEENLNVKVKTTWTDAENAKPVEDIQSVIRSYVGSGHKLTTMVMNSYTAGLFCFAKDTKTYYKGMGVQEKLTSGNLTKYFSSIFPGVELEIYDEGWVDESNVFHEFVPNNKILCLGDAPAGEICDVVSVPSLHTATGEPAPGKFAIVIDKSGTENANPHYDIVGGIYCLPRIRRPEAIRVVDVTQVLQG